MALPQGPQPPQSVSWRDAAIARSEIITDAWEVTKTYAGRVAEWVLFFCMIANIVEILPSFHMWEWLQNAVLGTQAITLDIAGFGLASMGEQARQRGDERAARKAETTGKFLIGIMILTLLLVSVGLLFPPAKPITDLMEKGLILVRVVMTVIYGHVIHSLRRSGQAHREEQERALADLRAQLHQATAALSAAQQAARQKERDQEGTIQELREQLASMERAQSALLAGTEGQSGLIKNLQTRLTHAEAQAQQITTSLTQKQHECERLRAEVQHVVDERTTLQQENQRLSAELETATAQVGDLTVKVEQVEKQYSALRVKVQSESASEHGRKSERGRSSHPVKARGVKAGKITPIEQARMKQKTSDAEILAYIAEHPGMRVPAIAAHFAVTSRTIYNILKRQSREPDSEDATEARS